MKTPRLAWFDLDLLQFSSKPAAGCVTEKHRELGFRSRCTRAGWRFSAGIPPFAGLARKPGRPEILKRRSRAVQPDSNSHWSACFESKMMPASSSGVNNRVRGQDRAGSNNNGDNHHKTRGESPVMNVTRTSDFCPRSTSHSMRTYA